MPAIRDLRSHRPPLVPRPGRGPDSVDATDYLAVVAHELANPIASIAAAAQMLAKECHGRAAAGKAAAIAEEARQMCALLESLSDLSAVEGGRLQLNVRHIDLAELVRATAAAFKAPHHRIEVDMLDEPMIVDGDEGRIREVLWNLLANAAKYSPAGTRIDVRAGIGSDGVALVQVRDHGPGVPTGERARLFGRLVRLSTSAGTRGSGLGLYLSRAVIEDHGGRMWAEWPAGDGTIFSFTVPLAEGQAAAARAALTA